MNYRVNKNEFSTCGKYMILYTGLDGKIINWKFTGICSCFVIC